MSQSGWLEQERDVYKHTSGASTGRSHHVPKSYENISSVTKKLNECLAEPLKPQYGGGIIRNPEFSRGIPGWSIFRNGSIGERTSGTGNNKYLVSYSGSASKQFLLEKEKLYAFSGNQFNPPSPGFENIEAVFKSITFRIIFQFGCRQVTGMQILSLPLKSAVKSYMPEQLKPSPAAGPCSKEGFPLMSLDLPCSSSSNSTAASEIWADSISLQPFTAEEWRHHQTQTIQKARTRLVRVKAMDANGALLRNATVSIKQQRPGFPFGAAIPKSILTNSLYQNWFTSRFTVTTFENEMKWYSTETSQGNENYYTADAMLAFAEQHRIAVRGTTSSGTIPSRLIAWDVNNENLHFSFFEQRLGSGFSGDAFWRAGKLDPGTTLFLNDYNTLEQPGDTKATPDKYLAKLKEMRDYTKYSGKIAIGVESHFNQPNIPFMRAALDKLAGAGVPIWLTEVDVFRSPNQAQYLEAILREGFSHPAVRGIVMWAGWHAEGCDRMCLTDNSFKNLPSGDVVDKLISEWRSETVVGRTDKNGIFEARLFHGEHEITVLQSSAGHYPLIRKEQCLASISTAASEIWADSISLQPFTAEEWRHHQTQTIKKERTRLVRVKAMDANGALLRNATISIKQQRPGFPFGAAIPKSILTNSLYQNWFTSRFTVTTFENEMKWYSTETSQGNENYYTADAMLAFAEQHRIALKNAAGKRLYSIVSRYKGRLIAWDVNNENLHFSFFEQRLGSGFSGDAFWQAGKLDPGTMLFLNDYNTLEQPGDTKATPDKYLAKLKEMRDYTKYSGKIAIGVESHFNQPNIPFMRAALDKLAGAGVPIWLTEVDVFRSPNQAQYLEAILREGFSYPAVRGIVMWAGWHAEGCDRMCLTDSNFKNLPSGDVVDKLISEWRSETVVGRTDNNGIFEARLFHGEHEITVLQSSAGHLSVNQEGAVLSSEGMMQVLVV
ncbi:hypothetical protein KSP39_PZI019741 [Platanthera zijinensis]|uniref:GH10 domain-containing protein n=1 Tax=Platanthera zijinensis TaxID=2320716 RepID=A0AAP0FXK1_9ASPA